MFLRYLGIAQKPRVYQFYKPKLSSVWKCQTSRSEVLRAGSVLTITWETKIKTQKLQKANFCRNLYIPYNFMDCYCSCTANSSYTANC